MRKLWVGAIVLLLSTIAAPLGPAAAAGPPPTAGEAIPGQFIITLRDSADARSVAAEYRRGGAAIDFVYTEALNGFAGKMSDSQVSQARRDARVLRVEQDQVVTANETQPDATWGLDRSDARSGLDGSYTYDATGTGVTAYIIDTGIRATHTDFGGRVSGGYTAIDDGNGTNDCNGHGTHVAGTVGGARHGIAKDAALVAVRVLDCGGSGSWAGVIAGLDWVTGDHAPGTPAVANMSLGGGANSSVDEAVERAITDGVSMAVAAGNGNAIGIAQDACKYSPARVPAAITVGATTKSDAKASWSNYGSCVDWFAPGVGITSAWYTSDTGTNTISGTSMATPHVAGAAALYLQGAPSASPATVRDALYEMTTKGVVTSSKTANNHLLYTLDIGAGGSTEPTNAPPSASFTHSCTDLTCAFTDTSTDSDGSIASRSWAFGDGGTSTETSPSHTYAAGGTYTVALTVTDDKGATGTTSKSVTVTAPAGTFTMTASGYKVKGVQHADLTWSGATSTHVDVHRDGSKVATTENDGAYTDKIDNKGGGSYTYKVCEAGTTTCSNEVTVSF